MKSNRSGKSSNSHSAAEDEDENNSMFYILNLCNINNI